MLHRHPRRLLAAAATTTALVVAAPAASAMPVYDVGFPTEPERVKVVHVQRDAGLDWSDAALGAAAAVAVMLVGHGGARVLARSAGRERRIAGS